MQNPILRWPSQLSLILVLSFACEKNSTEVSQPDVVNGTPKKLGWVGTENSATIPNDVQFYRGNLPAKVDLSKYLPPIGDQGQYGTCVAWSVGYYTRTGTYAIQKQLNTGQIGNQQQASPKDLFWSIPSNSKSPGCNGTYFQSALDMLQKRGVATMATVPYQGLGDCSSQPAANWTNEAAAFKIKSYRELQQSITAIKEKLAEDRLVMFGVQVTQAFSDWTGSKIMTSSAILNGNPLGGHALTIVGYDDSKSAFRIVNSWGRNWGDGGFAWVDYNLMANPQFANAFFVAYPDTAVDPNPTPNPVTPPPNNKGPYDLALAECRDQDDPAEIDRRARILSFDVYNLGQQTLPASKKWSIIYLYYNAFDADDYGVLLHQYVSNEFGGIGTQGYYEDGLGEWDNWWNNVNIKPGKSLGQSIFNQAGITWDYRVPALNGPYYLVVIADPFEVVEETNEDNNLYFITSADGGPLWFRNGVSNGLMDQEINTIRNVQFTKYSAVNPTYPNAYTPEEIRKWVKFQQKSGALKAKAIFSEQQLHTGPKMQKD